MKIEKLQLFLNSVCNLQCNFCHINSKDHQTAYLELDKQIQLAWADGSYLSNIKKVLNKIHTSTNDIKLISFWGGEPLLGLNRINNQFFSCFPNLDIISISTNFINIQYLIPFIFLVDNLYNKPIKLIIQISMDAKLTDLQEYGHKVDWDIYKRNMQNLLFSIGNHKPLKNLEIYFHSHSVLPLDVINQYFINKDNIKIYWNDFINFWKFSEETIKTLHLEQKIKIDSKLSFPSYSEPTKTSIYDGIIFNSVLKNVTVLKNNIAKNDNFINYFFYDEKYDNIFSPEVDCPSHGIDGLAILPDGTLCPCFLEYILSTKNYWMNIKDNPLMRKVYRQSCYKQKLYINLLEEDDKIIEEYDWYYYHSNKMNLSTNLHLIMNLALEVSLSGQIDPYYYTNYSILFNHIIEFIHIIRCTIDKINTTNTTHCIAADELRRILNGVALYCSENNEAAEKVLINNEI